MPKPEAPLGIQGDGRCLFRSVVHGAYQRSGKPSPSESLQRELADDLRAQVVDEFIKRRADTEWFLEDDFETYVVQMRQPHIWGGEPELLMSSHVLRMPITVYMQDKNSGSLKIIAEYGQEYGKDNPIRVLYNGYGHYDALRSPIGSTQSKNHLASSFCPLFLILRSLRWISSQVMKYRWGRFYIYILPAQGAHSWWSKLCRTKFWLMISLLIGGI